MKTKAVRLYGKNNLKMEEFDLPEMKDDEILAEVITDSLCMSTFKAVSQGENHRKVPEDIATNPIIVGHEFCGNILRVGKKWQNDFTVGDKFVIQPNIGTKNCYAPGYSYRFIGGDATKIIIQNQVMENGSLLSYKGDTYFEGSLVEPLSCVVGAFNANFHLKKMYEYDHVMGIKEGGNMALLGATGPMGFLAIDLAIHGPRKPKRLVVTGRTQKKLDWVAKLYPVEEAAKHGVELHYVNTGIYDSFVEPLRKLIDADGENAANGGFDDVFVFAPDEKLAQQGEELLAYDGCFNFFAGPADTKFSPRINLYNVHYKATHFVGTSGGNTNDMKQAISLIENKQVNVAKIMSHVLGLNGVPEATVNLPKLPGGKKVVYTHKQFDLTALADFGKKNDIFCRSLAKILEKNHGFWNIEAEQYFLKNAPAI